MPEKPDKSAEQVIREDGRYPPEAFVFLNEALAKAVKDTHGEQPSAGGQHHVTGRQICIAMRELATEKWGQMARAVLSKWNIGATIDLGNMVYLLIDHGFMKKTDEDSVEDFRDVFDFDEAFKADDEFELKE